MTPNRNVIGDDSYSFGIDRYRLASIIENVQSECSSVLRHFLLSRIVVCKIPCFTVVFALTHFINCAVSNAIIYAICGIFTVHLENTMIYEALLNSSLKETVRRFATQKITFNALQWLSIYNPCRLQIECNVQINELGVSFSYLLTVKKNPKAFYRSHFIQFTSSSTCSLKLFIYNRK